MLYLLDADTLITGDRNSYPIKRFPVFWEWLKYQGTVGIVKIPLEQYEEVTVGKGPLVDWLCDTDVRSALLLDEEPDPSAVALITANGYATDLNEDEIELIGRDPFLIAYAASRRLERIVVTFEVSSPSKQRANRKLPDVCKTLNIRSCTLFNMIDELDFSTNWQPLLQ